VTQPFGGGEDITKLGKTKKNFAISPETPDRKRGRKAVFLHGDGRSAERQEIEGISAGRRVKKIAASDHKRQILSGKKPS